MGFETLPEVNELNEKFVDYIITGEDSVIKHWLKLGASGFRLDVADELPDEFIFKLRSELKKKFKNYALIGEVWEDVTTKESYGTKRKYALGKRFRQRNELSAESQRHRLFTRQSKCQRYEDILAIPAV